MMMLVVSRTIASLLLVVLASCNLLLIIGPSTAVYAFTAVTTVRQQHHPRHHAGSPATTTQLCMGWGPDPIWSPAMVISNQPACRNGRSVVLKLAVPPETASAFTTPGQYVQVKTPSSSVDNDKKPAFLAMYSAPDPENATFDFLIKTTDSNPWLTGLAAGAALDISQVLGKGYAITENLEGYKYDFPTQNVILVAAGSGIAPIASAIESGMLGTSAGGSRTCVLYYGERTADDLCCTDQFQRWMESYGVICIPVLSQPDDPLYTGRQGYVQTALEEDGIPVPRNSGALLCGMKGMTESVKHLLLSAGVFEGRILFNF